MALYLLGATGFLTYLLTAQRQRVTLDLRDLKLEAHKYSGVDPGEFMAFLNNINKIELYLEEPDIASYYLYSALDHLSNLKFSKFGIEADIDEIVSKIGFKAELTIMDSAMREKKRFTPKYLNETFEYKTEEP
ncbi:hypothetical protein DSLPV1_071 [Dishui lake phycodnavirus 1]|uniref:hypothetical protein n=1 Tax=Dishui lake phycodnavirus 1 TaxID=2079134 RepID=UPI000CD6C349|nr:hypothetical protein C5Y57_gp071 [Dishui lake phycodnavirus 1]AUT19042.1 hypothetical protein DSLPV1_071 [Dishui lake phycodnavirus 1]